MTQQTEIKGVNFKLTRKKGEQDQVETIGLVDSNYFDIYSASPTALAALCAQQKAALQEMGTILAQLREEMSELESAGAAPTEQKAKSCTCAENGDGDCSECTPKAVSDEKCHCNACHAKDHIAFNKASDYLMKNHLKGFSHAHFNKLKCELECTAVMYGTAYLQLNVGASGNSSSQILSPKDVVIPKK